MEETILFPKIDLSKIKHCTPSKSIDQIRRRAELIRSDQASRRRKQLENEIALAIEKAGVEITPRSDVHRDVNKIAQRLTSSRKQRMREINYSNDTKRQTDTRTPKSKKFTTSSTSSFSTPSSSPASSKYSTPVKDFRHYPIVSSASRLHKISVTAKSEKKRQTAEKKRHIASVARLDQMKQDICLEANLSKSVLVTSSSTSSPSSPSLSSFSSLIVNEVEQSLCAVQNRIDQGRARSTLLVGNNNNKDRTTSSPSPVSVVANKNLDSSKIVSATDSSLSVSSSVTSASESVSQSRNGKEAKEKPWYKEYRIVCTIVLLLVAGNAIALPIFRRMSSTVATAAAATTAVAATTAADVVLINLASQHLVNSDNDATFIDATESTTATVTNSSSVSPSVLVVMLVATIVWCYAAWRMLQSWSKDVNEEEE